GGSFGIKSRDGFHEARHGKSVAHAAGAGDEAKRPAFAGQLDGNSNERRNARAINLRHAIEVNYDLTRASLDSFFEGVVQLLTGVANSQAAAHFDNRDSPR